MVRLCYSNLVPKAGLQLSLKSIACGLFLNIPTILPTINEYQIVFLADKTPLSNNVPPMGQDTCVYVYVTWQIQKRGVLELLIEHWSELVVWVSLRIETSANSLAFFGIYLPSYLP